MMSKGMAKGGESGESKWLERNRLGKIERREGKEAHSV